MMSYIPLTVKINKKPSALLSMISFCIVVVAVLFFYNAVDNSFTTEDKQFIPAYLHGIEPLPPYPTYNQQLHFITAVQHAVLSIAKTPDGLPYGQKREPKELYEAKIGLCYDRSRVIEKILRYSNFKTRHVFIFSNEKKDFAITSIIDSSIDSHAITEVLTKKGWLVVDSNSEWLSIDANKQPISIRKIQANLKDSIAINWYKSPPYSSYIKPFIIIYGLYSRHGYFYPPYNAFPDINFGEFIENFF